MSRVANNPIEVPGSVNVTLGGQTIKVKGAKGELEMTIHNDVDVIQEENVLKVSARGKDAVAMAGTTRALVNNMVVGVSEGFSKKLELNGVGYRGKTEGNALSLTLGFSHQVNYELPKGITAEMTSQTEIIISGVDKQQVGQVASEIRAFRPPEPYKGKGVRYADERVRRKEAKKK